MSNTGQSDGAAHRTFRCTFGPVRQVDLVWPPPDEDIDAFSIVRLDGSDTTVTLVAPPLPAPSIAESALAEPAVEDPTSPTPMPAVVVPPVRVQPRVLKPTFGDCRAAGVAPRIRPLVVPKEPPPGVVPVVDEPAPEVVIVADDVHAADDLPTPLPPLPFSHTALATDPETTGASRSAWLAVIFAAACALLTFIEYREFATVPSDASEAPPVPPQVSVANVPEPAVRVALPPASQQPAAKPAPKPTPKPSVPERVAVVQPTRPIPSPTPTPAPTRQAQSTPAPSQPALRTPAATPAPPPLMARVDTSPAPAPAPAPASAPAPVAVAPPPTPVLLARADPSPSIATPIPAVLNDSTNDEAGIQTTLTRFRTAYSKLDASAARDVWPTVDARALERAFQSLKSQDLRFESCKMTVTGARAQAVCKGRTAYVPRIGDQSPRYTSREWNFELRKADERWTIASARSL